MKRASNLFEKVTDFSFLVHSAYKASRRKRKKRPVMRFLFNLEHEIIVLQRDLVEGCYRPGEYETFTITDPKERLISAAPFRDRVLHHAIATVLEPILERRFIRHSYACRRKKGTHAALRQARSFSKRNSFFLKCDVRKFYQSIDHECLKSMLRCLVKDHAFILLCDTIIDFPAPGCRRGKGLPIGNLTSQHFANLYLDSLDHFIKDQMGVSCYLRYMDDFLLFGPDKIKLRDQYHRINTFVSSKLLLSIKEEATVLGPVWQGIPFLGFRIYPSLIRIRPENKKRFTRKVRKRVHQYQHGHIDSEQFKQSIASMVAHYSHGDTLQLRKNIFHRHETLC